MTPTKKTVITQEGMQRKLDRLIARALQRQNPVLYDRLYEEARVVIDFDQADPFAKVAGAHHGHASPRYRAINSFKQELMKEAIDRRFHPVKKPNLTIQLPSIDLLNVGKE